jgi:LuxR family maltose regulon positive regulatory protein
VYPDRSAPRVRRSAGGPRPGRRHWGVPLGRRGTVHPQLRDRLDEWLDGDGLLVASAPRGYGKSTQLAQWALQQHDPVVWITAGRAFRQWSDVIRAVKAGLIDLGLAEADDPGHHLEAESLYLLLHRLSRRTIVVLDNVDLLLPEIDLEVLESEVHAFPQVRQIVITSSPVRSDPLRAEPSRVVLGREDFAWTEDYARDVLGDSLSSPVSLLSLSEVVKATAGQARGILSHFRSPIPGSSVHSMDELRVQWALDRVRDTPDPERANRLLLTMAEFISVPAANLGLVATSPTDPTLEALLREGVVEAVPRAGTVMPGSYRVERDLRRSLAATGASLPAATTFGMHRDAADVFLANGQKILAIHHLARAGRHPEALELFMRRVDGTALTSELDDFRDAVDSLPARVVRSRPEALAARILLAHLPPLELTPESAERDSLVLSLPRQEVAELPLASRVVVESARVAVLVCRNRPEVARTLGRGLAAALISMPWDELHALGRGPGLLWAAVAEAELQVGDVVAADSLARAAHQAADEQGHLYLRYLSSALLSATRAVLGDSDEAGDLLAEAELHYALGGWPLSGRLWPVALARFMVALPQLDTARIARAAEQFAVAAKSSPFPWLGRAADLVKAYELLLDGDLAAAASRAGATTLESEHRFVPPLLRTMAATALFDIHSARGRPTSATQALGNIKDLPGHPFCVASRRAMAYLAQGEPIVALAASDECVAVGANHVARSLVPALLRRAVVQEALGMTAAADETFLSALTHSPSGPKPAHYFGIDPRFTEALWDRLMETSPELHARVYPATSRWHMTASKAERPTLHDRLSPREREVLQLLRRGYSNARISQELFVSPNTVKTHLSSLYRKLGVPNRREAMSAAETLGLG